MTNAKSALTKPKQRELPLSQWAEKDGVLHWCGGYAPDSLVGVYKSEEQKAALWRKV